MTMPQKIVLKSTTKISLNDRFTNIQKAAPQIQAQQHQQQQQVRATMLAQQQATAKNRRLALQMANRPAVQAALKVKKAYNQRSLQQRLGSNVRNRLNLRGARGGQRGMIRGGLRGMIRGSQRGMVVRGSRGRGQLQRGRGLQRNSFSGSQQSLVSQSSMTSRGSNISRGSRGGRGFRRPGQGTFRGRGSFRGQFQGQLQGASFRGRGVSFSGRGQFRQQRGRGRGQRRGGRVMRGRGGRGGSFSREQLDDQLEEYMAKTKGSLDAELDSYMVG